MHILNVQNAENETLFFLHNRLKVFYFAISIHTVYSPSNFKILRFCEKFNQWWFFVCPTTNFNDQILFFIFFIDFQMLKCSKSMLFNFKKLLNFQNHFNKNKSLVFIQVFLVTSCAFGNHTISSYFYIKSIFDSSESTNNQPLTYVSSQTGLRVFLMIVVFFLLDLSGKRYILI